MRIGHRSQFPGWRYQHPGPAGNGPKPQIVKPTKPELSGEDAVFPKSN